MRRGAFSLLGDESPRTVTFILRRKRARNVDSLGQLLLLYEFHGGRGYCRGYEFGPEAVGMLSNCALNRRRAQ